MRDKGWVQEQIESFDAGAAIEDAWLPPKSWYIDPIFDDLERDTVFHNNWLVAARDDQLANPGDYVAGSVAGRSGRGAGRIFHHRRFHGFRPGTAGETSAPKNRGAGIGTPFLHQRAIRSLPDDCQLPGQNLSSRFQTVEVDTGW